MPVAERPEVRTLDNFIGGRWVKAQATDFFDVHNPAVGDIIGRTPLSTAGDVDAAVQAAARAFPAWRDTPVNARAQYLKAKIVLEVTDQKVAEEIKPVLPRVLDSFQTYLREMRSSDLEGSAGLYRVRDELTRRVNLAVAPSKINAVLFKEIVVQ